MYFDSARCSSRQLKYVDFGPHNAFVISDVEQTSVQVGHVTALPSPFPFYIHIQVDRQTHQS